MGRSLCERRCWRWGDGVGCGIRTLNKGWDMNGSFWDWQEDGKLRYLTMQPDYREIETPYFHGPGQSSLRSGAAVCSKTTTEVSEAVSVDAADASVIADLECFFKREENRTETQGRLFINKHVSPFWRKPVRGWGCGDKNWWGEWNFDD